MYDESGDKSKAKVDRVKVVDTEDCSRGPLSGCIRLADSSRVIQRLKVSILERQFACHAFVWWTTFRVWQTNYWGLLCPLKHWRVTSKLFVVKLRGTSNFFLIVELRTLNVYAKEVLIKRSQRFPFCSYLY